MKRTPLVAILAIVISAMSFGQGIDWSKKTLQSERSRSYDSADFIRSVKTVTGRNLDWFFEQWLYKPGHPVFDVKSEWDAAVKVVRLSVAQVQDFSRDVPVFRVPVSIKLVTPKKTEIRKLWIEKREETFEIPLEEKPLLVRFDEDNVLIKEITFPKERDELIYQLGHDDVIGRMDAAALTASLQTDPFWAVRKGALEAFAQLPVFSKTGIPILKKASQDADSQCRAAAVLALGNLKDRAHLEFYKQLFRKDTSARVQAEALTAIGKTGDPSAAPFLKQAASVPSYRDMVRRAAEAALKLIEKK